MLETNSDSSIASNDHDRLIAIINSMTDGVISLDHELRIDSFNAATLNILNLNKIDKKTYIADIFKPVDQYNQLINIDFLIKSAKAPYSSRDYTLKEESGHNTAIYFSVTPVKPGFGSNVPAGYVLLLRDITKEISLEQEKNEFVSVVSHELRTPIATAEGNIGNAEFMASKFNSDDSIKRALAEAHKQVNYLSKLINDLSTLSRAETGKLTVDVSQINIHNLLTDLVKQFQVEAANKHINLSAEIDPTLELLSSSELYVKEILQNLISNALKYTEKGFIIVRANKDKNGVAFEVQDSGIGISKEDQAAVFDKFYRSADYRTRKTNGTGLGLYITMKLANLLKAEINLSSELNSGSTFSIHIPHLGN